MRSKPLVEMGELEREVGSPLLARGRRCNFSALRLELTDHKGDILHAKILLQTSQYQLPVTNEHTVLMLQ